MSELGDKFSFLKKIFGKPDPSGNVVIGSKTDLSENTDMENSTIVGSEVATKGTGKVKLSDVKSFGSKIHIDTGEKT